MWSRVGAADIKDIKCLIVTQIMNAGSRDIYRKALGTLTPPQSEYKTWPGHDFSMDTVEGQAILGTSSICPGLPAITKILLGSPVARWAGYFILQHKEKLGGNRFIDKVRIWIPSGTSLPYLLFYVNPTPAGSGSAADAVPRALSASEAERVADPSTRDTRWIGRSADGKHLVREHVMYMSS